MPKGRKIGLPSNLYSQLLFEDTHPALDEEEEDANESSEDEEYRETIPPSQEPGISQTQATNQSEISTQLSSQYSFPDRGNSEEGEIIDVGEEEPNTLTQEIARSERAQKQKPNKKCLYSVPSITGKKDKTSKVKENKSRHIREGTEDAAMQNKRPAPDAEGETSDGADNNSGSRARAHTSKKQRIYHVIGTDNEESVVQWYRANECLYNKKCRTYRDKNLKNQIWARKAAELQVEGKIFVIILIMFDVSSHIIQTL